MNIIRESERQRTGKNKGTSINRDYINSSQYRRKFDNITNDKELNKLIYILSKKTLKHRTGSTYEDMYWIDIETIKVVAKEVNSITEKEIKYSKNTKSIVKRYLNDDSKHLITIRSHPDSYPPSIDDFNSNYYNNYDLGIVICHDGRIFMCNADEEIDKNYYNYVVADYFRMGYNIIAAQEKALNKIQKNFNINFKEVVGHDQRKR